MVIVLWVSTAIAAAFFLAEFVLKFEHVRALTSSRFVSFTSSCLFLTIPTGYPIACTCHTTDLALVIQIFIKIISPLDYSSAM